MRRLSLLLAVLFACSALAEGEAVIVGVVASVNDEVAKKQADALAAFVGSAVKQQTIPRVYADQEALALAVGKGEVDLALMGPLAYLRVDQKAKAQLLFRTVRSGRSTYRSILFAPFGTKLTSLEALKKHKSPVKVAWVETSSATGYVIPKALLIGAGINPAQSFEVQDFLGSHDAVCKAVSEGKYDLGATFSDTGAKVDGCTGALGKQVASLKVVATSSDIPNDVVVAAPKFAAAKVSAVVAAAKAAAGNDAGRATLKAALLADGVADVKDEDFAPIRKALATFAQ